LSSSPWMEPRPGWSATCACPQRRIRRGECPSAASGNS
jgi:hypothetical protein